VDTKTALAVTSGLLIAIWTYAALQIVTDLSPWVGIAAMGCYFAAGGNAQGFRKTVFATLSGMIAVWVMMELLPRFGGSAVWYAMLLGVIAVLLVLLSRLPQLSFTPGAFVGAAVTVGNGAAADLRHLLFVGISLVIGAALGLAAETTAASLAMSRR